MVTAWDASKQRDCTGDLVGAQHFSNKFARGTGVTLSSLNRSPLRQRDHYIKNQEKSKFNHIEFDQPWRDRDWRPDVHKDKALPQDKDKSYSFSCTLEAGKREFKHKNKQPHPWAIEHTYTHVPESMQLGRARREGPRGIQNPMVRLQMAMGVFEVQRDPDENDQLNENVNEQVRLRKLNKHLAQLQEGMTSPPCDTQQHTAWESRKAELRSPSPGLEAYRRQRSVSPVVWHHDEEARRSLSPGTLLRREHEGWTEGPAIAATVTLEDIEKPEQRLRRLNVELADAQRAMLAAPDKQERKALRRLCRELDKELGGEHEGYREWKSTSTAITEDRVTDSWRSPSPGMSKTMADELAGWTEGSTVRGSVSPVRRPYVDGFLSSSRASPMEHSFNGSPARASARTQSPSPLRPASEKKKGAVQAFRESPKGAVLDVDASATQVKGNSQEQMTELIATMQNENTERGEVSVAVMDNMVERARKKFKKLDKDDSGSLEGHEVEELASWVWEKFHPGGKEIEEDVRDAMAAKLLGRLDENDDKSISFVEFEAWFKRTCVSIQRFRTHKARPDGSPTRARTPSPSPNKTPKKTLNTPGTPYQTVPDSVRSGPLTQSPSAPESPVTLDDIEKPEEQLRRLNRELVDAQEAMLASPDKQERKRLRRKCRELDKELGGEHEGYREWKSSLNSSQASDLGDSRSPNGYTDRFSSPMKARNQTVPDSVRSGPLTQSPSVPESPVTLDDIEKPEDRLRRLNRELVDAQEAMLASPDKQERKRLRRKCRELDKELGGEHEGYREWKSSLNSSQASDLGDSRSPNGYTDRFSSPMKARNASPVRPVQGFLNSASKPTASSSNFATNPKPEYEPMAPVDVDRVHADGAAGQEKARVSEEAEIVFGVSQSPALASPKKTLQPSATAESPSQRILDEALVEMGNNGVETGEVSVAVMDKMVDRARKKFNKLDKDASGVLEGHEVEELTSWVWCKFHPGGGEIDIVVRKASASKLLAQLDANGGNLSFDEFEAWFKRICVDIQRNKDHGAKSSRASPGGFFRGSSPVKPKANTSSKPPLPSPSPVAPSPAVAPKSVSSATVPQSPASDSAMFGSPWTPGTAQESSAAASSPALGFFKGSKQHAPDPFPPAQQAGVGPWFSNGKDGKWFSADDHEPAAGDDGPWFCKNGAWGKNAVGVDAANRPYSENLARPSAAQLRNQSPADLLRQTNSPGGFFRGASSAAGASPVH